MDYVLNSSIIENLSLSSSESIQITTAIISLVLSTLVNNSYNFSNEDIFSLTTNVNSHMSTNFKPTKCLMIKNSSHLFLNTTSTLDGTRVEAFCTESYYLNLKIGSYIRRHVFRCDGGLWYPSMPRCLENEGENSKKKAMIAGIVIGIIVGVLTVGGLVFLLYKCYNHNKTMRRYENDLENKRYRINDLGMTPPFEALGMPLLTHNSRFSELRGIPENLFYYDIESNSPSFPFLSHEEDKTIHLY